MSRRVSANVFRYTNEEKHEGSAIGEEVIFNLEDNDVLYLGILKGNEFDQQVRIKYNGIVESRSPLCCKEKT